MTHAENTLKLVAVEASHISTAPAVQYCRDALRREIAVRDQADQKGATMAPMDWLRNAVATWLALACKGPCTRYVPRVTNHAPR